MKGTFLLLKNGWTWTVVESVSEVSASVRNARRDGDDADVIGFGLASVPSPAWSNTDDPVVYIRGDEIVAYGTVDIPKSAKEK